MSKKILQISPYDFSHLGGVEKYAEILDGIFAKNTENKIILSENFKNWTRRNKENSQKQEIRGDKKILKGVDHKVNDWKIFDGNDKIRRFLEFSTISGGKDFEIIEPVKNCPLPKFWTPHFWKFVKKIRENPPEIIISHIRFAPTAWFAFWLSKSINAKYIHVEHGTGFLVHNNFFVRNIAKIVDLTIGKYILKNADFVVTISQAGEDWVKNFTGRTKNIETIYRGFHLTPSLSLEDRRQNKEKIWKAWDLQKQENKKNIQNSFSQKNFWENQHKKLPSPHERRTEGEVIFGFVGRLTPLKNLNSLLFALSKISFKNWQLKIVWDGEMRWEWEKLAKNLRISEKIIFLGAKENSWILENFLPNIDIFVNPSLQEWLPTTVTEAKIAECEVLATDVGGTHEIPNITLCEPTETDLKEKLEKILNNFLSDTSTGSVWQKISNEFLNKFSLEKMKENYEKIFEKF